MFFFSLSFFPLNFRSDCLELDFKEISYLVYYRKGVFRPEPPITRVKFNFNLDLVVGFNLKLLMHLNRIKIILTDKVQIYIILAYGCYIR